MTSKSACHFDPRLPTFWQRPESATPATPMKKCPMSCTCHAKRRSRLQNAPDAPPATRNRRSSKKEHGAVVKRDFWKSQNRGAHLEMRMGISQGNFYARIFNEKTGGRRAYSNPSTLMGNNLIDGNMSASAGYKTCIWGQGIACNSTAIRRGKRYCHKDVLVKCMLQVCKSFIVCF